MGINKICDRNGSGYVALDKDDLRRDDLVDEQGEIKGELAIVERIDERKYQIEVVDRDEFR